MKSRSKYSSESNFAKLQSPRPFSTYLSTYSPKIGKNSSSQSSGRHRSKSPKPGNRASSASPNISVHRKSLEVLSSRKSLDSNCHGCVPQSDFNCKLDVNIKSPTYGKIDHLDYSSDILRRAAIMPVGPSATTWKIVKHNKSLSLPSIIYGLTMSKCGEIFVTLDSPKQGGVVQCYDKLGNLTSSFPLKPSPKISKKFEPFQICEMPNGNLAVACSNCVTVWTREGKLIAEHGRNMFKFCKNIAVRSTGEIIVTDSDDSGMLKAISANGQFITKIPTDITCPAGVAIDSEDNIIVADWKHTIRVYDNDNQLIRTFGEKGGRDNEMDMPYGMCVDSEDNIIIADMWNHRVSVYSKEGKFINHLATQNTNAIHRPQYVSVAADSQTGEYKLAVSEFWSRNVRVITF